MLSFLLTRGGSCYYENIITKGENMKMNAKKIQLKIFAVLLVAIMLCCGFFLAGCKDGNEKDDEDTNPGTQSSTTISLSEAKTIIVNALALDEDSSSAEQQGNRDLFEKFGMVQLNLQSGAQDYTTGEMDSQDELVAYYEYSNNSIQKYNASGSSISAEYGELHIKNIHQIISQCTEIQMAQLLKCQFQLTNLLKANMLIQKIWQWKIL